MATGTGGRIRTRRWLGFLLIALFLLAGTAFLTMRGGRGPSYSQALAQRRDILTYYSFTGNLVPRSDYLQLAQEGIKARQLYIQEGELIAAGEPILRGEDGTRVFAREDGTVETLFVKEGELLQPGGQIARIVDYSRLEVLVDVDEYDISALEVGKQGEALINAPAISVRTVVRDIARDAKVLGGVTFYPVKLQVDSRPDILSGMSVEARFLKEAARAAVSLHMEAISYDEDNHPYVLLPDERGQMQRRQLQTGISDGVFVEILSGLSEGDTAYYESEDSSRFFAPRRPSGLSSTQP